MASTVKGGRPNSWILPDSASMPDRTTTESQQFGIARVVGVVGAGGGEGKGSGRMAGWQPHPSIFLLQLLHPCRKVRQKYYEALRPSHLADLAVLKPASLLKFWSRKTAKEQGTLSRGKFSWAWLFYRPEITEASKIQRITFGLMPASTVAEGETRQGSL